MDLLTRQSQLQERAQVLKQVTLQIKIRPQKLKLQLLRRLLGVAPLEVCDFGSSSGVETSLM
jgi:hypothetical protein